MTSRRTFLKSLAALPAARFLTGYHAMAASMKGKVKIRDIKTMMLSGPRTYTLVKIETGAGPFGIAEAYGSPNVGAREQIHFLKEFFVGKDPLEIDALMLSLSRHTDGSAHSFYRAVAGIEMALWDLSGKILNVPASTLLGGRVRDKVRVYNHAAPRNMLDKASCREWAAAVRADKSGFTGHKFGLQHTDPKKDSGRDLANRLLSTQELRNTRQGFENCREAIGWDHDIMVHCHWEYDLRTSLQLAEAIAPMKPLWLEDPLPVAYSESWKALCSASPVPIQTGENWFRRADALPFVVNRGCDILHPDLRNTMGFLETKKMADLADLYAMPIANHNTGSIVNTMATTHWGSSIRDYIACETVVGKGDWMDDVILHDGPVVKNSFIEMSDKPGLGIELNPDVVKAHLAAGETYW
ncbi:MAG TPA: mandelate racemase/muconate lactonizing enzyme family protein [Bryobacteraceae bacterium]|nr:mandelate racemase/muconate lactonizing enzyme family protein [Bryobacteraceae bacterium]